MVGPLPRQAEDRDVHAPRQGPGRPAVGRRAAHDRRGLEPLRQGRRRALDTAEHPAALPGAREAAGHLRAPRPLRDHDRRRLRRHRAQHHRLPRAGDRRRRALRRLADRHRRGRPLLRQPRLGEPAAEAQVLDLRLRRPLQRARDQLHLADRDRQRRPRGLRRPRRRRPLVGAADRPGHGRVHPQGRGERDPRRDHIGLVGGSQVPRLPRQGPAQVHGRRHRPGRDPRARRGKARPQARGLQAAGRSPSSRRTTWASTSRSRKGSPTSESRCISA